MVATVVIRSIKQRLAALARAVDGMRAAPNTPPDAINMFPFAITYRMRARTWGNDATWKSSIKTFAIDIHLSRLPDIGRALAAWDEIPEALTQAIVSDEALNDTATCVTEVRDEFRAMNYAGVDTAGYHIEIDMTVESAKS
jgi:hypothetical protein